MVNVLDFLFPRHCAVCGTVLHQSEQHVCIRCFMDMPRTLYHMDEHSRLEKNYWGKIPIVRVAALMKYTESFKRIIHVLKYDGNTSIGEYFGRLAAQEIRDASTFFSDIDCIIPIPLHWRRQFHRGYNQCYHIARGISQVTHLPILTGIVRRVINNESQTQLTHEERQRNVQDIFRCTHPERLRGKHILIIDDVITTGATTTSCALSILRALGDYTDDGLNIRSSVRISILALAIAE